MFVDAGELAAAFRYSAEQIDSYTEDEEFLEWIVVQPNESKQFAKGFELRSFVPLNPR
jgi:hypothetical protein